MLDLLPFRLDEPLKLRFEHGKLLATLLKLVSAGFELLAQGPSRAFNPLPYRVTLLAEADPLLLELGFEVRGPLVPLRHARHIDHCHFRRAESDAGGLTRGHQSRSDQE